ncbi:MAG: saccharopine dehydrogenase family protein [Bacteroidaceae bacterium]|nr:saccharopine dehydrogenase family protein [Bacteroidaceae bacterium]
MSRLLIIGAGGVATVAAHKVAQNPDVFTDVMIASRTVAKCDAVVESIKQKMGTCNFQTAQVDADSVDQLCALFRSFKPELVLNLALPYQDLTIMDACLECGVNYMDTANYEPREEAHFEYSWQWAYRERFEKAGLTAILGCGFDPGVSGIYTAYAAKHHFGEMHTLDIVDCNAGNHHKAFATNFNPEINIREITQKGLYYKDGKWIETEPLEIHQPLTYPNVGPRESYLMHHEELESLVINYPTIRLARFWMTFGQQYLTYLDVIQNLGMSRIDEIEYEAPKADGSGMERVKIVPLQFLKAVLPNPQDLGENYDGETSIGCRISGTDKEGKPLTYYVYNNCSHQEAYRETGMQGVSYTTGVPAMIGAMMFFKGLWRKPGVWNVEQFDPDPFMEQLNKQGLPWHEIFNENLELV